MPPERRERDQQSDQQSALASLRPIPTLHTEAAFWNAGLHIVGGVDEVGRGALAGPLVAAAVVLPCCSGRSLSELRRRLRAVNDSKVVPEACRPAVVTTIQRVARAIGVGIVEVDELDRIGVGPANRLAMERAMLAIPLRVDAWLLDACLTDIDAPQVGIVDGDATCLSIAAASLVAKVTRDRRMIDAHQTDSRFGFDRHKGYGTSSHLEALRLHGPGPIHRRCFAPVRAAEQR